MSKHPDFSGWATKNDLLCSDGRTIRQNAFKHCDGWKVPLVWNHAHDDPSEILGYGILQHRDSGVYVNGYFNETESGQNAKALVQHGDIDRLSIFAKNLRQQAKNVLHGDIKEVSLVLSGANPGAVIETVAFGHSDDDGNLLEEAIISTGDYLELYHSDEGKETVKMDGNNTNLQHADAGEDTVQDILDSMNEKQRNVVDYLVDEALKQGTEDMSHSDDEGEIFMKHNAFDSETHVEQNTLSHADMQRIFARGKQLGSLRDAVNEYKDEFLAHGDNDHIPIADVDWLFPDAKNLNIPPEVINNRVEWCGKVIAKVHHTPFSRVKSMQADIREDEMRARGYIKGNRKKEQALTLLKRVTTPTTVYAKNKFDRDDVVDITDFDVVAWVRHIQRGKLDEEIAKAILLGDGRSSSSDDKINEQNIRPIWKDASLYHISIDYATALTNYARSTDDNGGQYTDWSNPKALIRALIAKRSEFRGTGMPDLFIAQSLLTSMLLIEDNNGRPIYDTVQKLATVLRVNEIIAVDAMDEMYNGLSAGEKAPLAIMVNLVDYNVGADKGGAINMFDDFDIDYNKMIYLMETRCSGALVKPFSAMSLIYTKPSAVSSGSDAPAA